MAGQARHLNGAKRTTSRLDRGHQLLFRRRRWRRRPTNAGEAWRGWLLAVVCTLWSCMLAIAIGLGAIALAGFVSDRSQQLAASQTIDVPATGPLDAGLPQTATIYAGDDSVLAEINDIHYGRRTYVPIERISRNVILATVAAEDRRFFDHEGVDLRGLLRAVGQNAESEGVASGASTLEMQLVRNLYLSDERTEQTLSRKIQEVLAAQKLDERFGKSQLLEAYLNTVYYANQAYGIEAAAQRYFAKPARELSLPEAALLAGIPQSPEAHDPVQHFDLAKQRQEHILDLMADAGFISPEQASAAWDAPLKIKSPAPLPVRAPHWVNYIQDLVRARFGPELLFTGGLRIETTIDPQVQDIAERIVFQSEVLRQQAGANNTAALVIDPRTGHVLAMVGSKNFWDASIDGQVNVSVAGRQPGSSIKPLLYLAGFEHGLNPATQVVDQPTDFPAPPGQPAYRPANYENRYFGLVTLRDALGNSLNVPAVKVLRYIGVPALLDMARRLGITTLNDWDPRWLSLTLGGGEVRLLELTGAYAAIARVGNRVPVEAFRSVTTARGDVLYQSPPQPVGEQVVDPRLAYQLLSIMGDPGARLVTFGPNTPLNLNRPHMVKTGTTDDYRDTWTVGCLPQVCVGVWMGNTDNRPMIKTSSSLTAGKVWVDLINALVDRYQWSPDPFSRPDDLVMTRVPNVGSTRPGQSSHDEVFLPGQQSYRLEMDWGRP